MSAAATSLPDSFCWTKFGFEAGESPAAIRRRKEEERKRGGGIFYWGIGNSIAPSLRTLLESVPCPEVLFTPMRSRPAVSDITPERVVAWRRGVGLDGAEHELSNATVTSRSAADRVPTKHYALVCYSDESLDFEQHASFSWESVVNLRSGTPVGASQVTSVVRRSEQDEVQRTSYRVAFRARLVAPYFLTLVDCDLQSTVNAT